MPYQKGAERPTAKLTEAQVIDIVTRIRAGEKQAALAREFNVSAPNITHIKQGHRWGSTTLIGREKPETLES